MWRAKIVGVLLISLSAVVCSRPPVQAAQQQKTAGAVTSQSSGWPVELAPELLDLSRAIVAKHVHALAVIGPSGPGSKVSELDLELGDSIADALAQTADFRVVSQRAVIDKLNADSIALNESFDPMIVFWLSPQMQLDGYLLVRVMQMDKDVILTLELYGISRDDPSQLYMKQIRLRLDDSEQAKSMDMLGSGLKGKTGGAEISDPKCEKCPNPTFGSGKQGDRGAMYFLVTVTSAGKVGDVFLLKGVHNSRDTVAKKAIQSWRFQPARDEHGVATTRRIRIEIAFQDF